MAEENETPWGAIALLAGLGAAAIAIPLIFAKKEEPCMDGDMMVLQCWDGTQIITHHCANRQWQPTGNTCPEPPPPECVAGQTKQIQCPDGQYTTSRCVGGYWVMDPCPPSPYPPNYVKVEWRGDGYRVEWMNQLTGSLSANTAPQGTFAAVLQYHWNAGEMSEEQYQEALRQFYALWVV